MGNKIIPQVGQYTKVQTVSFMTMKLKSNIEWAKRACLVIYDQQTHREKITHVSNGKNDWGFNRNDAPLLTHLAAKLKQNRLTQEDAQVLLIKMPKYARQLICLSFEKDQGASLLKHLDLYFKDQKTKVPF
jgi:hypothetical protein